MADPRFFAAADPMPLGELAERFGLELRRLSDGEMLVRDVASLEAAEPDHLSFVESRKHLEALRATRAGAVLVMPDLVDEVPPATRPVLTPSPYGAYARIARVLYPRPRDWNAVHPSASVDPTARIGEGVEIGPLAVIGPGVEIGRGSSIGAGTVIERNVVIGLECRVHSSCTISHAVIGDRVEIKPGARIGQPGFGFVPERTGVVKIPQLGRVVLGDDVEVGANTTIDRGAIGDTVIGNGTMIDNLVQIAHNVRVGRGCILVSQTGLSGSVEFGDHVVVGGQVGFSGHLKIGDGAQVAAKSGVMRDIPAGSQYGGIPAIPVKQWHRQTAALWRLVKKRGE